MRSCVISPPKHRLILRPRLSYHEWLIGRDPGGKKPAISGRTEKENRQLATPYHAPNANPHVERFHRTLRQDALNHFIFLNAAHVWGVAREFIEYYNRARPSQATHAIPDPYPELIDRPLAGGKLIALPVLSGLQHDYRLAA